MWKNLNLRGKIQTSVGLWMSMKTRLCDAGALALSGMAQNLWWRAGSVAVSMAISDYMWAKYISTVASASAFAAASYGMVVVVLGAYIIVSYVEDKRMIAPAALGAWIGTYLAV